MGKQGSGEGGGTPGVDFERLARDYWNGWSGMLQAGARQAGAGSGVSAGAGLFPGTTGAGLPPWFAGGGDAAMPGMAEAMEWWRGLAQSVSGSASGADSSRFGSQANVWLSQVQDLASRFAGRAAEPREVVETWKRMLGGDGANPFAAVLQGAGDPGFGEWYARVAPLLSGAGQGAEAWLGVPAFGFTRQHQERWQQLARAQLDYQQQAQAFQSLLAEAGHDAFGRLERKLAERSQPGQQLESARALFDLWVDAAEESYAEIALSLRFREAYGNMVNAQMRLRAAVQREVEQLAEAVGMPTRSEVDAAHRKVARLEREMRRLREELAPHPGRAGAKTAARDTATAADTPPARAATTRATRKSAAKKAAAKKAAPRTSTTRKPPAKKSTAGKSTAKKSGAAARSAGRTGRR